MATHIANNPNSCAKRHSRRKQKKTTRSTLQKPNGVIAPRVKDVGPDKFAIVCVDPAKNRSEWMMADFYGNFLIEPRTVEHRSNDLQLMIELTKQAMDKNRIQDIMVTVERTGNYHRATQQAFLKAGLEVRIVHPFATKQFRLPGDAGNKTDETDLFAQHRAACAGFGLMHQALPPLYGQLQLLVRHRRDLVEKSSALACQIREHLYVAMPGYEKLFTHLFSHKVALPLARHFASPEKIDQAGIAGVLRWVRTQKIRFQTATLEKIVAWARHTRELVASEESILRQAIWSDLYDLYSSQRSKIARLEAEIAGILVKTPYVRLLAIPGINVVSAADFAGEMGPIHFYANANAITGRSGLYPSRYQSDQTDNPGTLIRAANRSLRAALMRIADNLAKFNNYFRFRAADEEARGLDRRLIRVRISKNFSRIAFAAVAGDRPMKHPCYRDSNSVIEKLREFHAQHQTPLDRTLKDLEAVVTQLPIDSHGYEAEVVAVSLEKHIKNRRGPTEIGELLTCVLAHLNASEATQQPNEDF